MNRGIYTAASGMVACQDWLDVLTHNLANASTTGFKRDTVQFQDALQREMFANGGRGPRIGSFSSGPQVAGRFTSFEPGALTPTGNPLDVALAEDSGAFAVETPQGVRYTRDGSFALDSERNLVTKQGHAVLDANLRPIALPPGSKISIDGQGNVSVDDQQVATIGVFAGTFVKEGASLFGAPDALPVDSVALHPAAIESSNVNAIETMVQMITLNRAFEMAQRAIVTQDEQTERLIQSLKNA